VPDIVRRRFAAALVVSAFNCALRTVARAIGNVPDAFDPFTRPWIVVASCLGENSGAADFALLRFAFKARASRIFVFTAYGLMALSSRRSP